MRVTLTALLICLVAATPANAWNAAGHKIIASIAYRQLTADERGRVAAILKRHPRFTPDFADEMPAEVRNADEATRSEWLFQQASLWPDIVRGGPADRQAFNRPTWHYVNQPHFLTNKARALLATPRIERVPPTGATIATQEMNIVQTLRFGRELCPDKLAAPEARAVMLAWLFHTIGDIHQPMHSVALFSERLFPEGDRGGNLVKTEQERNLHALWDNIPGQGAEYRDARNKALALIADERLSELGKKAAQTLDHSTWVDESYVLAVTVAYDAEIIKALGTMEAGAGGVEPIKLSKDYLVAGGSTSERRMVQAGYRLGAVLKGIVAE